MASGMGCSMHYHCAWHFCSDPFALPFGSTMQGKLEPVPLQSFKPPLAKQYAARQLQLKQELRSQGANLPQAAAAAQAQTEQEFAPRIKALHRWGSTV